ncbi:MAG TPA: DinB family protein [Ilumatobacteraceae bacterium]|nr:DinB family protein [Ilumatobacteraceae bacterium]
MTTGTPFSSGEKLTLHTSLQRHREVMLWKLDGLDEAALRRKVVPSGTSLLGLVKHLAAVEYNWFCETFGRATEPLPEDSAADFRIEDNETSADIIAFYRRAWSAADETITALDLDDVGTAWFGDAVSLRWVLVHMVEETARHAGHADIIRELIDGAVGYRQES